MDEAKEPAKRRVVPRFGPVFYWTTGGALAGLFYASAVWLLDEYGTGYWFPGVVHYSCIGAFVGLILGIIRDIKQ